MSTWKPGLELARSLLWREHRSRGAALVLVPVCYGVGLILFAVAVALVPGVLTSFTRHALEQQAALYLGSVPRGLGMSLALILLQGPYMIALLAGASGGAARGLLWSETTHGGVELLLGAGYGARDVFIGLLSSSFALAIIDWAVLAATALGVPLVVLYLGGELVMLPPRFVALALLVPAPLVLWSTLLTLFFGIALPRWHSYLATVRRLPALALLVIINLRTDLDPLRVGLVAIGLALAGTVAFTYLLGRRCRIEHLLAIA